MVKEGVVSRANGVPFCRVSRSWISTYKALFWSLSELYNALLCRFRIKKWP